MHGQNTRNKPVKLGIEVLEDRTVPTTFAVDQGMSLAVGDVIPGNSFTPGGSDYEYVTGTGPGTLGVVKVYDANGIIKYQVTPFAGWTGGIHVAVGEVTGTLASVATVSSASMAAGGTVTVGTVIPHGYTVGQTVRLTNVNAFDPATGALVYSYDGTYTITAVTDAFTFEYITNPPATLPPTALGGRAGVFQKDIIVSTAAGGTGRVRVYSFQDNQLRSQALLFPYGPNYVGGIQVATGNVTGDFTKELIVGQQTNGSVVKAFAVDPNSSGKTYFEIRKFKAFEDIYKGGVSIAAANIDNTLNNGSSNYNFNFSEIIVGKAKDAPLLRIFDAQLPTVTMRAEYFTFDSNINNSTSGINVAAGNTDGIRGGEIYVSLKNSTSVRIYSGQTGVTIGEFSVPYPMSYGRNLDIAINDLGDELAPGSTPPSYPFLFTDIFIVAGDGPYLQVPVVFPGQFFSPAGLNGSRAAP